MHPDKLAKSGSEHGHQTAFFSWCAMAILHGPMAANDPASYEKGGKEHCEKWYGTQHAMPYLELLYAIPNGGKRNLATASILKAEGVKSGVPDIHFPIARGEYHSLYIEMKKQGKGKLNEAQKDRFPLLAGEGNYVQVCFTWQEAVTTLLNYLSLGAPQWQAATHN